MVSWLEGSRGSLMREMDSLELALEGYGLISKIHKCLEGLSRQEANSTTQQRP